MDNGRPRVAQVLAAWNQGNIVAGCFYRLGVHFPGVLMSLIVRALLASVLRP